jgi:Secretion system C-terminal sorting domain
MFSRNRFPFGLASLVTFLLTAPCFAMIIHVNPGESIQIATELAAEGDTLVLADGTYEESITLFNHGLTLASWFILDGDINHVDNTIITPAPEERIITVDPSVITSLTVFGLTLSGGDIEPPLYSGGAINAQNIELTIDNCVISDNNADNGGAISMLDGYLYVVRSEFYDNSSLGNGGVINIRDGHLYVSNSEFYDNTSLFAGGAIRISESKADIFENNFNNNWCEDDGGAIKTYSDNPEDDYLVIQRNSFTNNMANKGGALYILGADSLQIQNNVFTHNTAYDDDPWWAYGGAICLSRDNSDVDINDNEFYYNISERRGSVVVFGSTARFYNNLLFNNRGNIEYTLTTWPVSGGITTSVYGNLFYRNSRYNDNFNYDYGGLSVIVNTTMYAYENDFYGNDPIAAGQGPSAGSLLVTENYWGHASGPYHPIQNPDGLGDAVSEELDVFPFSTTPFTTRWLHAPDSFDLIAPDAGEILDQDIVEFSWHPADDDTPHDTLRYALEIADNPEFSDALLIDTDEATNAIVEDFEWESTYYWRVVARDIYDLITYSTETRQFLVTGVDESNSATLPAEWAIERIYPNPFNRTVQVVLAVPTREDVSVAVYDLQGRLVDTLHHGSLSAGQHRFAWQPDAAAGMYFVRVSAKDWQGMRKVVYLK